MSKLDLATIVEEADVGITAEGFDNFLLAEAGLEELKSYSKALKKIGALRCSKVINELIKWVGSSDGCSPISVADSDPSRAETLWQRYCQASAAEDPQALAKNYGIDVKSLRKPPTGGVRHVIVIDLKDRCTAESATAVWHSFKRELGELNPSTRGSALKSQATILDHIAREYGAPIEIRFVGAESLASAGEVGAKSVAELKRYFSNYFNVSSDYLVIRWE